MAGGLLACCHLAQLHTQRIHDRGLVQRARLWATQGLALGHTASIHFLVFEFLILQSRSMGQARTCTWQTTSFFFVFLISFKGPGYEQTKELHLGIQWAQTMHLGIQCRHALGHTDMHLGIQYRHALGHTDMHLGIQYRHALGHTDVHLGIQYRHALGHTDMHLGIQYRHALGHTVQTCTWAYRHALGHTVGTNYHLHSYSRH
jgi:hypothetical protein